MNIVFDIGNVLIAWDPHAAFREDFGTDLEIDEFMDEIGFQSWNAEQDRGRHRSEAVAAIARDWPHWAGMADRYFDRFHLTIRNKIVESWALMERLRAAGHRIFSITNWSADTWPEAVRIHPQLVEVFEDIVISGHERVIKPDREIFNILCRRNNLDPSECLFIDDNAQNAEGARSAGWHVHHFTGPAGLRAELAERGML